MGFQRIAINTSRLCCVLALIVSVHANTHAAETDANESQLDAATHRQVRVLQPKVDGHTLRLNTIATTNDGHVLAAMSGDANFLLMLNADGETVKQWELELSPTSVTCAPDGTIFVGGSGKLAKLNRESGEITTVDSPHAGDTDALKAKTRESLLKSFDRMKDLYQKQLDVYEQRIAKIDEKDEADQTALEKSQKKAYERQVQSYRRLMKTAADRDANLSEASIKTAMSRALAITSLAATDKDLFVCASDPSRGGYSIWRVSTDLDPESSTRIMDGLRGCCGQMDIQCCQGKLVISENTNFKVGIYDRDGKSLKKFGARDRTSRNGFGGCCNPMNTLAMSDGSILTAESSIGHIKRFDTEGNLLAYIGKATIGGGCKHCALGYDAQNDLYYMMYQDKSGICVLGDKEKSPETMADKKLQQQQADFFVRAAGQWSSGQPIKSSGLGSLGQLLGVGPTAAQHPISSLTLEQDGTAKILAGRYKAYGETTELELTKPSDTEDTYHVAFAFDQVRYLEGTWTFAKDNQATVNFDHLPAITLHRTATEEACETTCGGANCANEKCEDANCPRLNVVPLAGVEVSEPLRSIDSSDDDFTEIAQVTSTTTEVMLPKFEYKVLSKKKLQGKLQETLSELGQDGWELSGSVGKELIFKRIVGFQMREAK